jgi:hypothetical protein
LQPAAHQRVGVDGFADGVNELDDELGHAIAGRGFAAEDEGSGHHLRVGVALDALEQGEDVQELQVLALVLVQALDQHIEHGVGIDAMPSDRECRRELQLVVPLDGAPFFAQLQVVGHRLQAAQLFEVVDPARARRAVSSCASRGLLRTIQRRGVTPLVLLENFSGVSA